MDKEDRLRSIQIILQDCRNYLPDYTSEKINKYISLLLSKQETDIVQRERTTSNIIIGVMGFVIMGLILMLTK